MKKFIVYLLVIVVAVSLGFAIFYLVRDDETISLSTMSVYKDVGDTFTIDLEHDNPKNSTKITITSSDDNVVKYDSNNNKFTAMSGGLARINFRTTNTNFRNLWCDVVVGDGTVESPYYITTAEQLAAIGAGLKVDGETNADGSAIYAGAEGFEEYRSDLCYKIVADIDASTVNNGYWVPLRNFSGRFDGNGRTISNINIDRAAYAVAYPNNVVTFPTDNAGLFQTLACGANGGVVYNLKISNFSAKGEYTNFGVIAGTNNGATIERIEITDTFLDIDTKVFGGIVAINETTEYGNIGDEYVRNVARIDRCSINLDMGQMYDDTTKVHSGNLGVIGGIAGKNYGGTIVYSYVVGDVYFAEDSTANPITYGGVVAINEYKILTKTGGRYNNIVQGANLRDCYSSVKTHLRETNNVTESSFAGGIAKNIDFTNKLYNGDSNQEIVSNYIIGVYYNVDHLRYEQTGEFDGQGVLVALDKTSWVGIAKFTYDTVTIKDQPITWADTECIVKGLKADEMKVRENFVSHKAMSIKFDDYGNIDSISEDKVLWLFDSVWTIDVDGVINSGMPYLNYQLVYIPDDFDSVGVPTIQNKTIYTFVKNNDYPITIAQGTKITIKVGDTKDLTVKPDGTVITSWVSSDNNIVSVDPATGKITGVAVGTASVTATSAGGATASIAVVVESVTQDFIINYPSQISVYVGQDSAVTGIQAYSMDSAGNKTDRTNDLYYFVDNTIIATVNASGLVHGVAKGDATLYISLNNSTAIVSVPVKVLDVPNPTITNTYITGYISVSTTSISGYTGTTGTISYTDILDQLGNTLLPLPSGVSVSYSSANPSVASINSTTGAYTLNTVGSTSFMVSLSGNNGNTYYSGSTMVAVNVMAPVVTPPPTGGGSTPQPITFTFKQSNYSVTMGNTLDLSNEITNSSSAVPTYISNDTSTATINSSTGLLTPIKTGTVSIVATVVDNGTTYTASCMVSVVNPVLSFNLSVSPATSVKKGTQIIVDLVVTNGSLYSTTQWSTSNSNISKVSSNNNQAVYNTTATGSVTITAKHGSSSASVKVTVTDDHPYNKYIYNRTDLDNVRYHLDKEFILAANIDLTNTEWTPIGTTAKPFTGKLTNNGNFVIKNLKVSTASDSVGLFAYTRKAQIEGIKISNSSITNGLTYAGALVGKAISTTISDCHLSGTSTISGGIYVGGIVGSAITTSIIKQCSTQSGVSISSTSTSASCQYAGGIVGYFTNGSITDVYVGGSSKVNIYSTAASGKSSRVGGIVGGAMSTSATITNAVVDNANIESKLDDADNSSTGGIVGYTNAKIDKATVTKTNVTGGLVGGAIGEMSNQAANRTLEMKDSKDNYKGYTYGNIKDQGTYNAYGQDSKLIAVTGSVNVSGQTVGGLVGCITSGILANSYTHAVLCSTSKAFGHGVGLLAGSIMGQKSAKGSTNTRFGVIDLCYSACSISSSNKGTVYAPSITAVHQKHDASAVGFAFRYVCLNVSNCKYYYNSNMAFIFGAPDYPDAMKSASDMKSSGTYTSKGFGSVWSISNGSYPTLRSSASTSWL